MSSDLGEQLNIVNQLRAGLKELPGLYEKIGGAAGDQAGSLSQLGRDMDKTMNTDKVDDMTDALQKLSKGLEKGSSQSKKMRDAMKKWGKRAAVAGAAAKGFKQGLTGMFSIIGSVTTSLFNMARAAVGTVMKAWEGLVGLAWDVHGSGMAVAQAFEAVRGEFGSLASNEGKAVVDSFKQIRSSAGFAAKTGKSLRYVFGTEFTAALKELQTIAGEFGDSFSQLRDQFVGSATELLIMNKGLNLSGEALLNLSLQARAAGQTMQEALIETTTLVMGMEKQIGIDGKVIGKNLDKLSKDMSNFGHMSKKQLVATAGYAAKLGVSIEGLSAVFDKFENFEDAATGAAKLAEAFGMNVDAMAMMNAESPAEQMDMMRQAFAETGKSLDDLSRSEKKYLEDLTGLKGADLYNAFDPANADMNFDDMLAAADEAEAKMDPAEAMLKAADKIEKAMDQAHKSSKGFFDSFLQGFQKGLKNVLMAQGVFKPLIKTMKNIYQIGYDLAQDIFGEPNGIFAKKNQKNLKTFNNMLKAVEKFFRNFAKSIEALFTSKSDDKVGDFMNSLRDNIFGFLKDERVDKFGGMMLQFIASGISFMLKGLVSVLQAMTGTINGEAGGMLAGLDLGPEMTKGLESIMAAFSDPAVTGGLKTAFFGLLTSMANAVLEWGEKNPEIRNKILMVMFGPAVIKSLFSGAMTAIGTYLLPMLFKAVAAKGLGTVMTAVATKILAMIGMTFTGGIAVISAKIALVVALVISAVQSLFQVVVRTISRFFDGTVSMTEAVVGLVVDIIMFVPRVFINIFNWLGNFLGLKKDALLDGFNKFSDKLIGFGTYIVDGIASVLGTIVDVIPNFFKKAWAAVESFFIISSPSKLAMSAGQAILDGFVGGIKGLASAVAAPFKAAWGAAKKAFSGAKEWASKKAQAIKDGFSKVKDLAKSGWETAKSWGRSFAGALGIGSPSKLMQQFAGNVNDGFNQNVDLSPGANKAVADIAPLGDQLQNSIKSGVDTMPAVVSEAMPNLDNLLEQAKLKISNAVLIVSNSINSVKNSLAEMAPINAEAMVSRVAAGLAGEGTVKVEHQGRVNIKVNFKVSLDAKELAGVLVTNESEAGGYFDKGEGVEEGAFK